MVVMHVKYSIFFYEIYSSVSVRSDYFYQIILSGNGDRCKPYFYAMSNRESASTLANDICVILRVGELPP
jgi:hypothetical protein